MKFLADMPSSLEGEEKWINSAQMVYKR